MVDSIVFSLRDEADTRRFAALLAAALGGIPLAEQAFAVHLSGDLGAGKTALARHLLRELGFCGPVKSPTFTLVEPYNSPAFDAYHFDLYRFSSPDQWFDAGFDDFIASPGLALIEWPENAAGALPAPDLRLRLDPVDPPAGSERASADDTGVGDARTLRVDAFGATGRRCLSEIRQAWRDGGDS
ncbi:MAG: tRNA (adenosine(37)-N6)-threonylcarbamoyltransferase complex ATPase subunit type 1 TsaE [Lautropia sp.]